jgi:hypothetical protein
MNRFHVTKKLGDGTYGTVLQAKNRQNGEIVREYIYDAPRASEFARDISL